MAENTHVEELEYGNVNISDDVIGIITNIAAIEVEGIHGLSGSFAGELVEIFGKKNFTKGVKVLVEENEVTVDLNVVVDYGVKIPDVAWEVQENVKKAIENMTGLVSKEINVHINGINFKSDKDKE